ncbi:MAG: hypothetical protein D3923_14365 [Candidatus Electrothrix sp. AR3]|nr:hypothetical protein [Candidatus Electrothrix sp. AR3]
MKTISFYLSLSFAVAIFSNTFAKESISPSSIPHPVKGYIVTDARNDCLDCHGLKSFEFPKPSKSHYLDQNGQVSKKITSNWYLCTQCHLVQENATPLPEVENTSEENISEEE